MGQGEFYPKGVMEKGPKLEIGTAGGWPQPLSALCMGLIFNVLISPWEGHGPGMLQLD